MAITKKDVFTKAMTLDAFSAEEKEVFAKAIAALEKRSSKPTKAQVANEVVKGAIVEVLTGTDEPLTAHAIAEAIGESTNKVAALLKQIEGVVKTEGKGKKPATYGIA